MEPFSISPLFNSRPTDEDGRLARELRTYGRLARELRTYDLLDQLAIPYTRIDHDAIATIDACHDADRLLGIEICKNLTALLRRF